jgi:hypothetical protein
MRRRLVLLAVAGAFVGTTVPMAFANPPQNQGTQQACTALEAQHGSGSGNQSGPPEDNNGTAIAEGVLGCNDNDNN